MERLREPSPPARTTRWSPRVRLVIRIVTVPRGPFSRLCALVHPDVFRTPAVALHSCLASTAQHHAGLGQHASVLTGASLLFHIVCAAMATGMGGNAASATLDIRQKKN